VEITYGVTESTYDVISFSASRFFLYFSHFFPQNLGSGVGVGSFVSLKNITKTFKETPMHMKM
jgi:hypothetical protein